jgi:hypothetical protein
VQRQLRRLDHVRRPDASVLCRDDVGVARVDPGGTGLVEHLAAGVGDQASEGGAVLAGVEDGLVLKPHGRFDLIRQIGIRGVRRGQARLLSRLDLPLDVADPVRVLRVGEGRHTLEVAVDAVLVDQRCDGFDRRLGSFAVGPDMVLAVSVGDVGA